jgi:hypothetical protein
MRSCRTAALMVFFMLPTMHGATAQDIAPELSTILRKNLAPVADAALTVRFPEVIEAQLDNGLTVLVLEDHRTPLVSMVMNIYGSGALYDPPGQEGLARITAGMLREGTGTRTGEQILEELVRLGATLESNSAFGSTSGSRSSARPCSIRCSPNRACSSCGFRAGWDFRGNRHRSRSLPSDATIVRFMAIIPQRTGQ